jgi:hypothetical protein
MKDIRFAKLVLFINALVSMTLSRLRLRTLPEHVRSQNERLRLGD